MTQKVIEQDLMNTLEARERGVNLPVVNIKAKPLTVIPSERD